MRKARNYAKLKWSDVDSINFDEVLQTHKAECRRSNNGKFFMVKWEGDTVPPSVLACKSYSTSLPDVAAKALMSTPAWSTDGDDDLQYVAEIPYVEPTEEVDQDVIDAAWQQAIELLQQNG